jgi:hypothetical protein
MFYMKRILVLSDSHGNVNNMVTAVRNTHPDQIIHLGDCWVDAMGFTDNAERINTALKQTREFRRMQEETDDFPLQFFFDMRESIKRIRRNSRVCFNAVLMRSALSVKPIASTQQSPR